LCKTPEERVIFAEFAKKCAHSWKRLAPQEKEYYHQLSELDKNRYDSQMKVYRQSKHKKSDKRRKRRHNQPIDDNCRRNSAFDFFAKQEMTTVRQLMPNINNEEMLNQLIKRWNSSGDEVKKKFRLEAEAHEINDQVVDGEEDDISIVDDNDFDNEEEIDDEVDEDCDHSKSSKV